MHSDSDRFLSYYTKELDYLRTAGGVFAKQYPKIARRLELDHKESNDPHTERLLESFAFLTAKLSQQIDDRFPEMASALLNVLHPHLINPTPSMAIAHFKVDPGKGKLTTGYFIKKNTSLYTYADEGSSCRFQTIYPLTLWPITVQSVDMVNADGYTFSGLQPKNTWFLKLKLTSQSVDFEDLNLDHLQFHIRGDKLTSLKILECLFTKPDEPVFVSTDGKKAAYLSNDSLKMVGFERHETGIPVPDHATHAFALLQEYFHFPDKFMFFQIRHLQKLKDLVDLGTKSIDILLPIEKVQDIWHKNIGPDTFLLGCTPIINLFPKTTDPQRLHKRKSSYRIIPDQRRDRTTEIYSIQKVLSAPEGMDEAQVFSPYFSFDHGAISDENSIYWVARRQTAAFRDIPGSDIYLSFVDLKFNPTLPPKQIFYAQTLCTNRFLAQQLPVGADLQIEESPPITSIRCLDKPVQPLYAPTDGETLWRLISQLSVNHLSLTGTDAPKILKETLKLYAGPTRFQAEQEIETILSVACTPVVRRVGAEAWRGFVKGLQVSLMIGENGSITSAPFLLGSVLHRYFALNVSINSFIELIIHKSQNPEESIQWQPLPGEKTLL